MDSFLEKFVGLRVAEEQAKGYRESGIVGDLVADEDMQKIFELSVDRK